MDDGIAATGNVQANYLGGSTPTGAISGDPAPAWSLQSSNAASGSYTAATCFDTNTGAYVVTYNGGQGTSCGLSFKFQ
jgi:hypothetical protein